MKITPADINGLVGIAPTPATPDAGDWRTTNSVNLPETEKMARILVDSGLDILMTTGTFGECASLMEHELRDFVKCVVDTVDRRIPVFAGIGTLNTRDTIRRSRELIDLGADGLFVARPMWLALDDKGIVRFYRDLAEAMPGVPMVVYDNPIAFKGKISKEAFIELAKIPEVVAAKHERGPLLDSDAAAVAGQCRVLPLVADWCRAAKLNPDVVTAAWSGHIACAPAPQVALGRAIRARDWSKAEEIAAKCNWAESAMFAGGELKGFMDYSIAIGHLRFAAAGLIDPGPPRPPYLFVPDEYRAGGMECGRRWATLQQEFQARDRAA
jgi:4-(2-carboxyphenyl)-2-oxobut-3-enoate aldolase